MKLIVKICAIFIFAQGISKSQSLDLNALKLAQKFSKSQSPINSVAKREKNQDYFIADKILDSDLYIVGPGDLLHINIIASNETFDHSIAISPSGKLLIPSVGIVNCEELTLSQLIEDITFGKIGGPYKFKLIEINELLGREQRSRDYLTLHLVRI